MRSNLMATAIAAGLYMAVSTVAAAPLPQTVRGGEIESLKAQLAALQAEVNALQQRAAAPSDGNLGTTRSESVVASDKRLSALEKLVDNTSVSGKMYFDFTHIDEKNSDTGKTDASGVGLDVKRFYLGIDHKFDDIWSANLTTDFNYSKSDGRTSLFVKKAYVQGKFSDAAVFRVGSASTPWIPFVEKYYGFRYVENTLIDRLKFGNSADWGLHLGGDVGSDTVHYAVAVLNGRGYKNPGRSKGVDFEGRIGFTPFENMVVAVGGYSGHRGQETETIDAQNTAQRGDIMLAYASDAFRLGAEYFTAKNWSNVLTPLTDKADGYSVWGSVALSDAVSLFARYDHADLSKTLDSAAQDIYYNAGVEYQVGNGFKLAGVWKHGKTEQSVGTPLPPHVQSVKINEIGVFGEVSF